MLYGNSLIITIVMGKFMNKEEKYSYIERGFLLLLLKSWKAFSFHFMAATCITETS